MPWIRLDCSYFTHRKTARLVAALGDAGYLLPIKLWTYAASNQADGVFEDYEASELATLLGHPGDAKAMLQALLKAGFLDDDPLRIHDWDEFNAYHASQKAKGKKGAEARWGKSASDGQVLAGPMAGPMPQTNQPTNGPRQTDRPTPQSAPVLNRVPDSDAEKPGGNGSASSVDDLVGGLVGGMRAHNFKPPTLGGVREFLRLEFDGADKFARAFLDAMTKSKWTDREGVPIRDWRALAKKYASSAEQTKRGVTKPKK